jgi:hypothetical protein
MGKLLESLEGVDLALDLIEHPAAASASGRLGWRAAA